MQPIRRQGSQSPIRRQRTAERQPIRDEEAGHLRPMRMQDDVPHPGDVVLQNRNNTAGVNPPVVRAILSRQVNLNYFPPECLSNAITKTTSLLRN